MFTKIMIFFSGLLLGVVLTLPSTPICHTIFVPTREAARPDVHAAILQCPVSTIGLREWREACKSRSRMQQVKP